MAKNPSVLVVGLPEQEELLLRSCLGNDPLLSEFIEVQRSLSALLRGPTLPSWQYRNGIWLVVLDRTYNIEAHTYTPRGADPFQLVQQLACVRTWFPKAQVVCATNSPLRFEQEQSQVAAFDQRFLGIAPYVKLHRNLHFVDETQK